jgi:secondary thiamine-phosphate synthase enzyme
MAEGLPLHQTESPWLRAVHTRVELRTDRAFQLVDITSLLAERVRRSGVFIGTAAVQSRHTTAGLFVNENEPRLLEDMEAFFRRLVPEGGHRHDDLELRDGPVAVDERPNGHAHLRALLLPAFVSLNVVDGELDLGRWQSVFLAELDGPRTRSLSVVVTGAASGRRSAR